MAVPMSCYCIMPVRICDTVDGSIPDSPPRDRAPLLGCRLFRSATYAFLNALRLIDVYIHTADSW